MNDHASAERLPLEVAPEELATESWIDDAGLYVALPASDPRVDASMANTERVRVEEDR